MSRTICWFSCGAPSAVATTLILKEDPDAIIAYCETGGEHEDNERFLSECEAYWGKKVVRIRSEKYKSTWDVWRRTRYMSGVLGARCTQELKLAPRIAFQRPDDIHVFGYTADSNDVARAKKFDENFFELETRHPLINAGLTKAACPELIEKAGISPPITYALGLPCANCIPCVKAETFSYWALIRQEFPEQFERAAKLSRELGVRLARWSRAPRERIFIDEIPSDWPTSHPIAPACDFMCTIVENAFTRPTEDGGG